MLKYCAVLLILPALALAQTPVRQCAAGGDNRPTAVFFGNDNSQQPAALRANHCRAEPCNLSRNQGTGSTLVEFTSRVNSATIMPHIRARAFGIWTNQELPADIRNNPCSILSPEGHSCPLVANQAYSYVLTIPIGTTTPLISTEVEVSLRDAANNNIFCYAVANQIVN